MTVLLQPAQSICGRVVDANGRACVDGFVTLSDPTPIDANRPISACVENLLGAERVLTDATGAFRFEGVLARPYTLAAWSQGGDTAVRRAGVSPGDDVELTVIPCEPTTLTGRVVTAAGRPVAGATVGEQRLGCASAPGRNARRFDTRVRTDDDGRFTLPIRGGLHLIVDGPDIVPVRVPLQSPHAAGPLLVRVARRRAVHIDAGTGSLDGLALAAADADGRLLESCDQYGACEQLFSGANGDGFRGLARTAHAVVLSHRGVAVGRLPLPAGAEHDELCFSASLARLMQPQ